MARRLGNIPLVSNYEPNQVCPIDARQLADTKQHMTQGAWWRKDTRLYNGMLVTCQEDGYIYTFIGDDCVINGDEVFEFDKAWLQFRPNGNPYYPLNYGNNGTADNLRIGSDFIMTCKNWDLVGASEFMSQYNGLYVDTNHKDAIAFYNNPDFISIGTNYADLDEDGKQNAMKDSTTIAYRKVFYPNDNVIGSVGIYIPTSPKLKSYDNLPLYIKSSPSLGICLSTSYGDVCNKISQKNGDVSVMASGTLNASCGDASVYAKQLNERILDSVYIDNVDVDSKKSSYQIDTDAFGIYADKDIDICLADTDSDTSQTINIHTKDKGDKIKLNTSGTSIYNTCVQLSDDDLLLRGYKNIKLTTSSEEGVDSVIDMEADDIYLNGSLYLWQSKTNLPNPTKNSFLSYNAEDKTLYWKDDFDVNDFTNYKVENVNYYITNDLGGDAIADKKFYLLGNPDYPSDDARANYEYSVMQQNIYYDYQGNMFGTAFYALSDAKKKTNIMDIPYQDENDCLKPHQFQWIDSSAYAYGFVAQEIEHTKYSALVKEDEEGLKRVDYNGALCVAIAQLQEEIRRLKHRVEWLERPYSFY